MNKAYRFFDLNKTAQARAIIQYIDGWEETHDEDDMTFDEVNEILCDNNLEEGYWYTRRGWEIPENEEHLYNFEDSDINEDIGVLI